MHRSALKRCVKAPDVNWIEAYSDVESVADQAFRWRGGLNTRTRTSENGDDWRQDMSSDELRQRYLNNLETLLSALRGCSGS